MNETNQVPIVILNGFLGSGKTTLFRNLLSRSRKKNIATCAIVNDMSELDVDGELISNVLEESNSQIFNSISSCVLSSKKGIKKLGQSIANSIKSNPEVIIIETSGSCHPMPLIKYFEGHNKVELTGVFVLLDSQMISQDFNCGINLIPEMQQNMIENIRGPINLLVEQILFSSNIILTKTDKVDDPNYIATK
jgi:G3E family GTPase